MDYQRHYDLLVGRGSRSRRKGVYLEKHHILPKCLGGSDDRDNLVYLTPEEHYVAHQLLVKLHPDNFELSYAAMMMCKHPNGKRSCNKLYGWLKRKNGEHRSLRLKGKPMPEGCLEASIAKIKGVPLNQEHVERIRAAKLGERNPNYGKTTSEETRQRLSASVKKSLSPEHREAARERARRRWAEDPEYRELMRKAHSGRKNTPETLKKMSASAQRRYAKRETPE